MTAGAKPRFVVVGAGHAGAAAAETLAVLSTSGKAPCSVVLIDADPELPYERPNLSKEMLISAAIPEVPVEDWSTKGIEFRSAAVTAIDRQACQLSLSDGGAVSYDGLLLAPGGLPRSLAVPGGEHALTIRTLADARRLHAALRCARHLVVIGAGVVGLEVASSARALGLAVTVIEAGAYPMARSLTSEIGQFLIGLHRSSGVTFRFGAQVEGIEVSGDGYAVTLADDVVAADLIVAGIGFVPHTALAREAGLKVDRGIVVDEDARTSDAAIWAAGDATVFADGSGSALHWQTWQHARRHGAHAARRMVGLPSAYRPISWFWSDQHGCNIQVLGHSLRADEIVLRGHISARNFTKIYLENERVIGAVMVNRGADAGPLTKLISRQEPVSSQLIADEKTPLRAIASGSR